MRKEKPKPKLKHKPKPRALVCVAHPDDETIFFAGLILSKKFDWTAVCVTDANADGKGELRHGQFHRACRLLGIQRSLCWNYPDIFLQRLNTQKLQADLNKLGVFQRAYTHGILGEYGHIHHQDVSFAVHQVFAKKTPVYSPAYNLYPEVRVALSKSAFAKKQRILRQIYAGESMRFLGLLPATSTEGFVQLSLKEVQVLYEFLCEPQRVRISASQLRHYQWLRDYIEARDYEMKTRPF